MMEMLISELRRFGCWVLRKRGLEGLTALL